ncbi:MAG: preprotein translocase subunit YajC [Terrimesophilobacter sp.]
MDSNNGMLIIIAVGFAAIIAYQIFASKRRKAQAEESAAALVPGVEVMTRTGLFGTLVSIDRDANEAMIEIAPKVVIKIHPGAIMNAVPEAVAEDVADEPESTGPELNTSNAVPMAEVEPEFGERAKKSPRKKSSTDDK